MATLLLLLIYLAFISLGLPDALLGAVWPVMQPDLQVPYSFAGIIQVLITGGTIVSSFLSGFVIRRFGTGKVTAVSVGLTAAALLGFAFAPSFWWILIVAVPLGIGAGSVDAGLNTFVANNYKSHHMSWLHSFWGVGALGGPLVLSFLLSQGFSWRFGYKSIGVFQVVLVAILAAAIPLWNNVSKKKNPGQNNNSNEEHSDLGFIGALKIKGVPMALLVFLFYCGIESSMGLWGGSFLYKVKGMDPAIAARWVSFFFAGITLGRFITGFLTFKLSNNALIHSGALLVLAGVLFMVLPLALPLTLCGFLLVGFGCAPIFPSMLHETPIRFGKRNSQLIMGFQMGVAYIGASVLPPLFGFIAGATALHLLPFFLLAYILLLLFGFERLRLITKI
jgi:fucose permease